MRPRLAPALPLPIPESLALGEPAEGYLWPWSIYRWLDADTWARGRAWALWKALIIAAGFTKTNAVEAAQTQRTLDAVLAEHF